MGIFYKTCVFYYRLQHFKKLEAGKLEILKTKTVYEPPGLPTSPASGPPSFPADCVTAIDRPSAKATLGV